MAKKPEGTDFTKAVGLKAKVMELIVACSEVSNYLTVMLDDIQNISALRTDAQTIKDSLNRENEAAQKALSETKKNFEIEKNSIQQWKDRQLEEVSAAKNELQKSKEESNNLLASIAKKESELNEKLEVFEKKRRDLEARHAKIAELAQG